MDGITTTEATSTHRTVVRDVDLAPPSAERLLSTIAAPGHDIERLVRPYKVTITARQGGLRVVGEDVVVGLVAAVLERVAELLKSNASPQAIRETETRILQAALKHDLAFLLKGVPHPVRPMSLSQVAFMNAMLRDDHALIFGVGPTGTGKTHLACAAGLNFVAEDRARSFVITRPRVLLEGQVMTPELRAETLYDEQLSPVEDVLHDLVGHDELARLVDHGLVQIMPLGRMRGRTFNECFVLIDEAQNMTVRKMRMALTRLGRRSKMAVTGDLAQIDLPNGEPSGLTHILGMIEPSDLALVHRFQAHQIIRNELVAKIEALYEQADGEDIRDAA